MERIIFLYPYFVVNTLTPVGSFFSVLFLKVFLFKAIGVMIKLWVSEKVLTFFVSFFYSIFFC